MDDWLCSQWPAGGTSVAEKWRRLTCRLHRLRRLLLFPKGTRFCALPLIQVYPRDDVRAVGAANAIFVQQHLEGGGM